MARSKKPKKQDDKPAVETLDSRAIDAEKTGEEIENWADQPDSDNRNLGEMLLHSSSWTEVNLQS